jgi:hypothetical protein
MLRGAELPRGISMQSEEIVLGAPILWDWHAICTYLRRLARGSARNRRRRNENGNEESEESQQAAQGSEEAGGDEVPHRATLPEQSDLASVGRSSDGEAVHERSKHNGNEESEESRQAAQGSKEARGYPGAFP